MLIFYFYLILANISGNEIRNFSDIVHYFNSYLTDTRLIILVIVMAVLYEICKTILGEDNPLISYSSDDIALFVFQQLQIFICFIFIIIILYWYKIGDNISNGFDIFLLLLACILPILDILSNAIYYAKEKGAFSIFYGFISTLYNDAIITFIACKIIFYLVISPLLILGFIIDIFSGD